MTTLDAPVADVRSAGGARDHGVLVALVATVAVAVASVVLPASTGEWWRGLLWAVLGITLLVRARTRPESTVALRVMGGGALLLGIAWFLLVPNTGLPVPSDVRLQLLVPGATGVGVASLIATPSWRYRAPLLDGVVLAVAGAAIVLTAVGGAVDRVTWVAAYALSFSCLLGPAVLVASSRRHHPRPDPVTALVAGAFVALGVAGVGTVVATLQEPSLPVAVGVAWAVAPALAFVAVWRPAPVHAVDTTNGEARRPSPLRLIGLTALGLVPSVVAAVVARDALVPGLLASLFATVVVAARVAVSARFDVEEAREVADVRFDALVEHAAEVLALLDDDGRIFYVSRAVVETFGVPADAVLGRLPTELAHPDDVATVEDALARVPEHPGVPLHTRVRMLDGDGTERHAEVTVVDLRHIRGVGAISLTVRDVTERVSLEAELVLQARTDSLTGLATRNVLLDRIQHVLRARTPEAALLFIDLDNFKLVNDGFGHAAGDDVLLVLSRRLRSVVREHDTVGRVGGDEFAVLLERLDDEGVERAMEVAQRLLEVGRLPIEVEGEPVEIGMSVGVAAATPGMAAADLFTAADAAMYEAKRDKLGVVLFNPGMRGSSRSRLRLMRDIRTAIEHGTPTVVYQPIVHTDTLALHGVEALLRWEHPTFGPIAPDDVLDLADAVGMTAALTDHIIATIGDDLAAWREATGDRLPVAVNLSAQQLVHVDPEQVLATLRVGALGGNQLMVEVTETSMLGDVEAAAAVLEVFRAAGCEIAVDDFGTGYASIGYLRQLPLDVIKIDREFVRGLDPVTVRTSFASVIHGLARNLRLRTVAEGVESREHLAAVRVLGCEYLQGYLVSQPLTLPHLLTWARTWQRAGARV